MNNSCAADPVSPDIPLCLPCCMAGPQIEGADFDAPGDGDASGEAITGAEKDNGPRVVPGVARPLPEPKAPTLAEIARHCLTHRPYAPWCRFCVAGRRNNSPHRRIPEGRSVPMLSADYVFFRDPGGPMITFLVVTVKPHFVYFPRWSKPTALILKLFASLPAGYRRAAL